MPPPLFDPFFMGGSAERRGHKKGKRGRGRKKNGKRKKGGKQNGKEREKTPKMSPPPAKKKNT